METLINRCKVGVARAITHPAVGGTVARIGHDRIRNQGLLIDVSDPVFSATVKAQLFWNLYEGAEIRFVRQFFAGQRAVIDLGASLGIAALHALDVMDAAGQLVCIEAHPELASVLRCRFRDHPRVHVEQAAIAYGTEEAEFVVAESLNSSRLDASGNANGIRVPAKTLADVVGAVGFERFALISDIEGAEAAMLEEDADVLQRCALAVIELHEVAGTAGRVTVDSLRIRLSELGFKIVAERGPVVVLVR